MGTNSGYRKSVSILLLLVFVSACAVAPPVQEMSDARQAIAAAEEAAADRWARDEISEARQLVAEAEADIGNEFYGAARSKALRAQDRAMRALQRSIDAAAAEADP